MTVAPLSSAAFFGPSLFALENSTRNIALSSARLATGNRLHRIGDDVAAFSVATRLQSQITTLKQAANNAAQGDSMLQVASGGLTEIADILDEMNAVATQANSGSLTTTERAALQAQFSELYDEIDRIAGNTAFGNVSLLNGDMSGASDTSTTTTVATKATGTATFSAISAGNKVIFNGTTLVANTDFTVGVDLSATLVNLNTALNNSTTVTLSQATYTKSGNGIVITHDAGGALGRNYTIDQANSTATFTTTGDATATANVYTLSGGIDNGLYFGSVRATGTIGDNLITAQSQTQASVTLTFTGAAANNETFRIDSGTNAGYLDFTFKTVANPASSTEVQIGADTAETIQNLIAKLSQYTGSDDYGLRQLEFSRDGSVLTIRSKVAGNPKDLVGNNLAIATTVANSSLSAASFSNGTNTGINVSGLTNADFNGTSLTGFSATYVGADNITASITIGSSTYTASITDTTPSSDTTIRFSSSSGGYFDIELDGGNGTTVANQTNADTFAARLNSALSTLSFTQERIVSSFTAAGDLAGASARIRLGDYTDPTIDSISVTAPSVTDGVIEFTIDGETFRSASGIGDSIGAYESIKLTSLTNGNNYILLTNGATANSFSDSDEAADFATALREAFGLNDAGTGKDFQVGESGDDKINVVINDARTGALFNGDTPSVSTQDLAEDAMDSVEAARDEISEILATVGALQSRFTTAGSVINNSITYLDAARANLADTDIASEATYYALEQVKMNAAISVIAQTRQMQSGLLQVLQFGQ